MELSGQLLCYHTRSHIWHSMWNRCKECGHPWPSTSLWKCASRQWSYVNQQSVYNSSPTSSPDSIVQPMTAMLYQPVSFEAQRFAEGRPSASQCIERTTWTAWSQWSFTARCSSFLYESAIAGWSAGQQEEQLSLRELHKSLWPWKHLWGIHHLW